MSKRDSRPYIKNYFYLHDFLTATYNDRKNRDEKFSYEVWSRELGFSNKSFLRQMVVGKRSLSKVACDAFAQNLNLQGSELDYFETLFLYAKAKGVEQKDALGKKLRQLIHLDYSQEILTEPSGFVLKTLYPRLQTLLSFQDLEKTSEILANLLKTTPEEIEKALAVLEELQLATKTDPQGSPEKIQWKAKTKSFKVPEDLGSKALLSYHENALLEAIAAQSLEKNERRYRSLLVALNEEEFMELIKDLEVFVKQVLGRFDTNAFSSRKLFQINFNLHAVTSSHEDRRLIE